MTDPYIHEALFGASYRGDLAKVRELLKAGAKPDKYKDHDGRTALFWTGERGHSQVVSELLGAGADVNNIDKKGGTALHEAARRSYNMDVISILIKNKANLEIKDKYGYTPLMKANEYGEQHNVARLVKAGAKVNHQTYGSGFTALHLAAQRGYTSHIPWIPTSLLRGGADVNIKDNAGNTALQLAAKNGHMEIVSLLINAGADLNISDTAPMDADRMFKKQNISSVLDFLTKQFDDVDKWYTFYKYQEKHKQFGIEKKGKMFYNIKSEALGGQSLLEYVESQNVRLTRQREELIDFSVLIAKLNNTKKEEKKLEDMNYNEKWRFERKEKVYILKTEGKDAMEEVINHYKSGLHSGEGLRDMIIMIQERFPWSSSKTYIKSFVSLLACVIGIGLYVLDIYTDIRFSLKMFNGTDQISEAEDFDFFLKKKNLNLSSLKSVHPEYFDDINSAFREKFRKVDVLDDDDYELTGWIAVWHIIQPLVGAILVFISINYRKVLEPSRGNEDIGEVGGNGDKTDTTEEVIPEPSSNCLHKAFFALWSGFLTVCSVVPIPVFTEIYRFQLDIRSHIARSRKDFTTRILKCEEQIRKHEAIVHLAIIIEASFEAYFQFWLQANYSLPDIFSLGFSNIEQLVTYRTLSIVLSFITIAVSIIKIRNKDKNEALPPLNIIVLLLEVFMDVVSRVLIFFVFMIVHNQGNFSPLRTLISFYTMVGIMVIFNMVFNERRNFCSSKYWLEVVINSFSSTLSLNQVNVQTTMAPERKRKAHKSKFVKQLCYYLIVVIIQISLTVVTLVMMKKTITIVDTSGNPHEISANKVFTTLGIGWAAFCLAIIFNILYYALHPSNVDLLEIKQKLVVALFGYEINLVECTTKDLKPEMEIAGRGHEGLALLCPCRRSTGAEAEVVPESIPLNPES